MFLRLKIIGIISFLFLFVACQKIIEIDLPKHEVKPVVNCLFSPNRPFKVYVSLSKSAIDTTSNLVENAHVVIAKEDGSATVLKYEGNGYYSDQLLFPKIGMNYTLKVNIPNFEEASAISCIPEDKINLRKIESKSGKKTQTEVGLGEDAIIPVQIITVDFLQNEQIPDFMGVSIIRNSFSYHRTNDSIFFVEDDNLFDFGFLESEDISIKSEGLDSYYEFNILLFRDLLFRESASSVNFNFEKQTDSKFWLRFFHFSPDAFNYLKSWIIHYYTQDYDFWEIYEPQPQFSNIKNGYGIFAGYSEDIIEMYPDSTLTY